jgi:glutaminyl-peptide cyclotransferase
MKERSSLRRGALPFCLLALLTSAVVASGCSHGAAPLVTANQSAQAASRAPVPEQAPPPSQTGGFDGQKAYEHVAKLVNFGPRPPDSAGIHLAQQYIHEQLASYGCAIEEDDFHAATPIGSVAMKNIVAKSPGEGPGMILLLTHYDTLRKENFVGGVDGGSSTGLMLEIARLLCAREQPVSVWIAFLDGEEAFVHWSDTDSIYGSRELAAKLAVAGQLKHVKAVILADMVGPKDLKIRRESNSTAWLTELVWHTAERLGYRAYFLPDETAVEDDHLAFLRRGVPAVDLIDLNDYPYWHTSQDTLDKVSPRSLAIVGHVILETLNQLEKR